ncbi:MAG: hypothetical protein IJ057_09955 [Bacteroidales bacterium]|nr:hypothetical protein [Bacteroidales bacterium]
MKKLALALACLVSVAFFASCDPVVENPEPSIQVLQQEGYLQNGDVVDLSPDTLYFGFTMASNNETNKELAKLTVKVETFDTEGASIESSNWTGDNGEVLTGTSYTYTSGIYFGTRDIIGRAVITATVTDAAGETATATIQVSLNEAAQQLIGSTFTWYRLGSTITGLDEFGLNWRGNYPRDTYAKLEPKDGVKLFIFHSEDWTNVNTDVEKAALFNNALEIMTPADNYFNVNVTQANMTYDDVLGTVMADGTCHLIHVTNSHAETVTGQGTAVTITGEAK